MNPRIPLIPFASTLLALSLITACSDSNHSSDNTNEPRQEHKLRKVGNAAELESYLKSGLKTAVASNGTIETLEVPQPAQIDPAPPADDSSTGGNAAEGDQDNGGLSFSDTNLIESGVDEADVVKTSGEYFYVAEPASEIYFTQADIGVGEPGPGGEQNQIRVMRSDDATHSATEVARIGIPHSANYDYQTIAGLILAGDDTNELVAISNASSYVYSSMDHTMDQWSSCWSWSYGSTIIDTFDISSISSIAHQDRIEIDGYLVQTRRIEDKLYVVTRYTPAVNIGDSAETQTAAIDASTLDELLPKVSINGEISALVDPQNCFVDADATGYPTLMVVTAIDLDDNSLQSSCVTANMYSMYMSKKAVYLTQAEWSGDNQEQTHIYKFALDGDGPIYRGEGSVEGTPTANQNFSINEHDDILRIATVRWDENWNAINQLHTFAEGDGGDLQRLATLPNEQHPKSIGKPGETIQGVRFVGDMAYVVTFLQTDPLYVIDLSVPENPFIAGEVEIPGFSTMLQPLGEQLLLGIGSENGNDLKVELYDVANPSAPASIGKYVMNGGEGNYSYSAAAWEHHALSLLPQDDNSVRIALPFYRNSYSQNGYSETQGAVSFSVDVLNRNLTNVAEADATSDAYNDIYRYGEQRVLLHGDTLHYIQGSSVWSSIWGSSATMANPQ